PRLAVLERGPHLFPDRGARPLHRRLHLAVGLPHLPARRAADHRGAAGGEGVNRASRTSEARQREQRFGVPGPRGGWKAPERTNLWPAPSTNHDFRWHEIRVKQSSARLQSSTSTQGPALPRAGPFLIGFLVGSTVAECTAAGCSCRATRRTRVRDDGITPLPKRLQEGRSTLLAQPVIEWRAVLERVSRVQGQFSELAGVHVTLSSRNTALRNVR